MQGQSVGKRFTPRDWKCQTSRRSRTNLWPLARGFGANIDSNVATALRTTVVVCFTWAIVIFSSVTSNLAQASGRSLLFLVLSGLATGASWLCYFRALQLGEASRVAPVDKLSVVFVLLFAALFLGEKMHWQTILGATLIVGGVVILSQQGH
jgi:transporter family protein